MKEILEQLQANRGDSLDLTSEYFDMAAIKILAEAIANNTSVNKLSFELCNLIDKDFEVLAGALLKREMGLGSLNIKENNLTSKSVPWLIKLMQTQKIKSLDCSYNIGLTNDSNAVNALLNEAKKNNVVIIFEPSALAKLPPGNFFISNNKNKDPAVRKRKTDDKSFLDPSNKARRA